MDRSPEFGIPGLSVQRGDHICALYRSSQQRDEVMLPFLCEGLRTGDKCISIVDSSEPLQLLADPGNGIDVERHVGSGQLEVRSSSEAYLQSGRFSPHALLAYLDDSVSAAMADGRFAFVRVIGEMPRSLSDSPQEELLAYESELKRFAPQYPQAILCLFDVAHFAGMVIGLLKTHHKMLFDDVVFEGWRRHEGPL
ncbi:MAG: protein kinase family protein [Actinobacteria bacterium]|nr:protein kinase family protein [Actinomycetota bacterium]